MIRNWINYSRCGPILTVMILRSAHISIVSSFRLANRKVRPSSLVLFKQSFCGEHHPLAIMSSLSFSNVLHIVHKDILTGRRMSYLGSKIIMGNHVTLYLLLRFNNHHVIGPPTNSSLLLLNSTRSLILRSRLESLLRLVVRRTIFLCDVEAIRLSKSAIALFIAGMRHGAMMHIDTTVIGIGVLT